MNLEPNALTGMAVEWTDGGTGKLMTIFYIGKTLQKSFLKRGTREQDKIFLLFQ